MQKEQSKLAKCQLSDVAASVELGTSVKATSAIITPPIPQQAPQPRQTRQRTQRQLAQQSSPDQASVSPRENSLSRKTNTTKRSLRAAAKSVPATD